MEKSKRIFLKLYFEKKLTMKKLNEKIKELKLPPQLLKMKKNEKIKYFQLFFELDNLKNKRKINKKEIDYSYIQCQNKRGYMEDRIIVDRFDDFYIFGVFDGHGGSNCVNFVKENFFKEFIVNYYTYKGKSIEYIIQFTIYQLHYKFLLRHDKNDISGTTLCILLLYKDKYYIVNLGDSKCIFISNKKIQYKTHDHSPEDVKEKAMIESKGGYVENNRILGRWLNISRTIGDRHLANLTSRRCDIQIGNIKNIKNLKVLLTSDGMYEGQLFPEKKLKTIVNSKKSLKNQCKEICEYCKTFSTDNLSILILRFK